MDRLSMSTILRTAQFCLVLVLARFSWVSTNVEGDALSALKNSLVDPNNVLQSWDVTLVNPCTWFHVTCNDDNLVNRVDLGKLDRSIGSAAWPAP